MDAGIAKLKTMIDGNSAISEKLQSQLLKQIDVIATAATKKAAKKVKPAAAIVNGAPKKPCQFELKKPIVDKMIAFANWEAGSQHSRAEVMGAIWDYVKTQNLRDESNKRLCHPDSELLALLDLDSTTTVISYPTFQKHIGKLLIATA